MSLIARHLEAAGLPTVIIGSALDIVERCGVPRFLFVDFPLGNPCGRPWQRDMQRRIVEAGVALLETASAPQTTVHAAEHWGDDGWRHRYMEVTPANRAELAHMGEERRRQRGHRARLPSTEC